MLKKLKEQLYTLIKEQGYNIKDNRAFDDNFPALLLRLNNYMVADSFQLKAGVISFVIDIFSTYNGEQEIITIAENLVDIIPSTIVSNNPEVLYGYQKTLKILDDNSTGPVRKHGVLVYEFLVGRGEEEVADETD